jgi:hypothetical protein
VLAIEPMVKESAVLYVLAASIHPKPGSYTFSNETSTDVLLFAGTRYLHARGLNASRRPTSASSHNWLA